MGITYQKYSKIKFHSVKPRLKILPFYSFNSKCCLNDKHFSLQFLCHLKLKDVYLSFMKRKAEFSTKKFWHKISGYMGSLDAIESTLNIEFSTHTLSYFGHLTRNSLYVYTLLPLGIINDYNIK